MNKAPVDPDRRKDFRFRSKANPQRSFMIQIDPKNLVPSPDNPKVAWISITNVGKVKARGFNRKLFFGQEGMHDYSEALKAGELPKQLTTRISRDTCGDYFVSITFSEGQKHDRELYLEVPVVHNKEPVGVDVGIKDVAILSSGKKIENQHFKQKKQKTLVRLSRELSRRWGPANMAYRDYNKFLRKENQNKPEEEQTPLAQPSKRYLASQHKRAEVERKIARKRDTYYHQQTAVTVRQSSMIAMETLHVSNMLRNHKLAFALADAAMSDFLAKLKYKAERTGVEIRCIGTFEPTSQMCSYCGEKYPPAKNLNVRQWTCPNCGTHHDRDINAAKNILHFARINDKTEDIKLEPTNSKSKPPGRRRNHKGIPVFPDDPNIVVTFSRELTKHNDPRYIIENIQTHTILDNAQGFGYRSASNAKNCYKAKCRHTAQPDSPTEHILT